MFSTCQTSPFAEARKILPNAVPKPELTLYSPPETARCNHSIVDSCSKWIRLPLVLQTCHTRNGRAIEQLYRIAYQESTRFSALKLLRQTWCKCRLQIFKIDVSSASLNYLRVLYYMELYITYVSLGKSETQDQRLKQCLFHL